MIDNFPRSATINAQTDSKFVILSLKNFDILLDEYPRAGIKILKGMTRLLCFYLRKVVPTFKLIDFIFIGIFV